MAAATPIDAPALSPGLRAAVLLVDDNAGKRLAVRAMLAPLHYQVVEADSGRAALLAVENQGFAVILMDVVMPIMDGYETARLIRRSSGSQSTPIIFLTAFGRDETEKAAAYANGAVDFIFTPVLAEVLRAKVAAFVHLFQQSEELQRSLASITALNIEMVARLAAAAELRDDETGQHTRRVGNLSVAIAERLGVPEPDVGLIGLAAPLHDVGKIALPDAILCKPGKLTPSEFEQMKTHAAVGGQMLSGSAFALLEVAEDIALTHHERWDGSGYPNGLAGDEIPIAGRIVAVADVFDALTHDRPYKSATSSGQALEEIRRLSGRQFDPSVAAAFELLDHRGLLTPVGALEPQPAAAGR
jgi:putative two-component system response regulator